MISKFMVYKIQEPYNVRIERINYKKSHWHDNAFEFILVLKGSINALLGCENYKLKEDDVLIISPEDVHSFKKTEEDNIVLFFQVNFEYFQNIFPNIMQWILFFNPEKIDSEDYKLKVFRYELAKLILNLQNSINPIIDIIPFISYCEKNFQTTHMIIKKDDVSENHLKLFYKIDDYIYRNFTDKIELSEIANFLNYNKYYFSKLVKDITGMTFLEYLNHVRVLAAERFLISTDKNISDIAYECGFSDLRSMTRYFKKWHGYTPHEYRKYNDDTFLNEKSYSEKLELENNEVKEKINSYISKLEKIKEIDLDNDKIVRTWSMPSLIWNDKILENKSFGVKQILDEAVNECSFKTIIHQDFYENNSENNSKGAFIERCLEGRVKSVEFFGEEGLFTEDIIKKPLYFNCYLLSKLSRNLLFVEDGFVMGKKDIGYQIILYNTKPGKLDAYSVFKIILNNIKKFYKIKKYYLDDKNGNSEYYIKKLGRERNLSKEDLNLIKKINFPKVVFDKIENVERKVILENLKKDEVILIEIEEI